MFVTTVLIIFINVPFLLISSSEEEYSSSQEVKQKEPKAKSDAKPSRESKDGMEEAKPSKASDLKWMFKKFAPESKPTSSCSNSLSLNMSNGTSLAKKEAVERKRKAHTSDERASSSEGEDEESASSEFEGEDEELDSGAEDEGTSTLQGQILLFFQEASLDELSLIAGCSVKKAKKIVALRPFAFWHNLVRDYPPPHLSACSCVTEPQCSLQLYSGAFSSICVSCSFCLVH